MTPNPTLKLISVNIEGHRHFEERVLPFLQREQPDVVCMQEVFEVDVPAIEAAAGVKGTYIPLANVTEVDEHQSHALGHWGLYVGSRLPVINTQHRFYKGSLESVPQFMENRNPNSMNRAFLWSQIEKEGAIFTIGTTHFTWSVEGASTPEQLQDLQKLLAIIQPIPDIVFCGDFNAPRGRETFSRIAALYKDNIPPEVDTSLDAELHKAGPLTLMVDGLFSTPEYQISNVQVVGGVSDHKAIVAQVSKAANPG